MAQAEEHPAAVRVLDCIKPAAGGPAVLPLVQIGEEPSDWKPMTSIGAGVREIRVRQATGAYRVIYLATIGDAVHVLHAFQKRTQATAKRDIDLARIRLKQIR